ncbi:MAG: GatB/YqeY domain-containing protein [Coriobacteriia bacterium]
MDKDTLTEAIKDAMRAKDKPRLSVLRLVKNEVDTKEKESGEALSEAEVTAALKKVLKQTHEQIENSEKAGSDPERIAYLRQQAEVLEGYLPEQVTGEALEAVVERVLAEHGISEKRDMGKAIGLVFEATGGNCDKAEVARLVGSRLT